jgi:hypothetical protein
MANETDACTSEVTMSEADRATIQSNVTSQTSSITSAISRVLLYKNRDSFLDHYWLRYRNCYRFWHRDSDRLRYVNRDRVRNRDFDWYLDRVRDRFLDRVWHFLLNVDRVRFWNLDRVGLLNRNSYRELHRVGNLLLDMYWVGLRDRDRDFLCHCYGLHVLNLVSQS